MHKKFSDPVYVQIKFNLNGNRPTRIEVLNWIDNTLTNEAYKYTSKAEGDIKETVKFNWREEFLEPRVWKNGAVKTIEIEMSSEEK